MPPAVALPVARARALLAQADERLGEAADGEAVGQVRSFAREGAVAVADARAVGRRR